MRLSSSFLLLIATVSFCVPVDAQVTVSLGQRLQAVDPALLVNEARRRGDPKLGSTTISYNLHSMDLAGVWQDGFLDLDETQHIRGRGEGVPLPKGTEITRLAGWQWGHDGSLDYPREGLLTRCK